MFAIIGLIIAALLLFVIYKMLTKKETVATAIVESAIDIEKKAVKETPVIASAVNTAISSATKGVK